MQTLKEELKKILPEHLQPQFDHLYDEYQYQVYTFTYQRFIWVLP